MKTVVQSFLNYNIEIFIMWFAYVHRELVDHSLLFHSLFSLKKNCFEKTNTSTNSFSGYVIFRLTISNLKFFMLAFKLIYKPTVSFLAFKLSLYLKPLDFYWCLIEPHCYRYLKGQDTDAQVKLLVIYDQKRDHLC